MTVYLGTLGRMIPIYTTPSAQLETEERYSLSTTLEGRRKAQVKANGPRTWSLNAQFADPIEQGALAQFANGAWGRGPFRFLPADSMAVNLLAPKVSVCESTENPSGLVADGGPVLAGGVWFARSYLNPSSVAVFFGKDYESGAVPVVAGQRVTGSVHVTGVGARAQLTFYDAAGVSLGSSLGSPVGTASGWVRSWVSVLPPAGAVSARIFATSSTVRAAGPAITWSDSLLPWGDGLGCVKSVVSGSSRDALVSGLNGTFSNLSFTVSEVG